MTGKLNRIVHAASATEEDRIPLTYAASLALAARAELVSVHATEDTELSGVIPNANDCLAAAGLHGEVHHERLIHTCCDDDIDTLLDAILKVKADLIVLGAHHRDTFSRLVLESHSEAVAENTHLPTLVVPLEGGQDDTGLFALQRALIPAADALAARVALRALGDLVAATGAQNGNVVCLGVGTLPSEELAPPAGWTMDSRRENGPLIGTLVEASEDTDLILMATHGRDSLLDTLIGTRTERLAYRASAPLLMIPMAPEGR